MDRLVPVRRSQWKVFDLYLNSEGSYQIHLLTYLDILLKQKETPGKACLRSEGDQG